MMEVALVFDRNGNTICFHDPKGSTGGSIPDSRDLWEVLWENRDRLGGVAHTHPWDGPAHPSLTDLTTFDAVERALGKQLLWPVVSFTEMTCVVRNPLYGNGDVTHRWTAAGPLTITIEGIEELRDRGYEPTSACTVTSFIESGFRTALQAL